MPFRFLLPLLFFLIPLMEIYLLIEVGRGIGAWPTIFLVVFTAVLGAYLLRLQGLATLTRVQQAMAAGQLPAEPMLEGVLLLAGGLLLLTPGFVTDAIGFVFLIAPLRRGLIRGVLRHWISRHLGDMPPSAGGPTVRRDRRGGHTIEGDYERHDDPSSKP